MNESIFNSLHADLYMDPVSKEFDRPFNNLTKQFVVDEIRG